MSEYDALSTLLLADTPLIDTRAPAEFARGSLPTAINLPLMTDDEREQVGVCYKQQGQDAAIALGHKLVSGATKRARVSAWVSFIEANPTAALFCFRGGLRSQISQQWLADEGVTVSRIEGGYKRMRSWLSARLIETINHYPLLIVGGPTGSAKTEFINSGCDGGPLPGRVDLEGIANHRGSAFGRRVAGQPTQIGFELALAIAVLKAAAQNPEHLILEDEARLIGRCALPEELHHAMKQAPIAILQSPFEARVEHSYRNYILTNLEEWRGHCADPEAAFNAFAEGLRNALDRIRKRLGGVRHKQVRQLLDSALSEHATSGDSAGHREWISILLKDYYDPMYEYQLQNRRQQIRYQATGMELVRALCP